MTVHLYAACWNEVDRLDGFFAHYDSWVDQYFIFDDGSDDGSCERLGRHPRVTVERLQRTHADSLILSLLDLYNHGWKASRARADWVVVVNVDEWLSHEAIGAYLERCRAAGYTAVPALGYQVVPPRPPQAAPPLWAAPFAPMNKLALFDPTAITEIHYEVGRHRAAPTGNVRYPARDELLSLHWKHSDPEWTRERIRAQRQRLGPTDVKNGWGHQYHDSDAELRARIDAFQAAAVCLDAGHDADRQNTTPRWWREAPPP